VLAGQPNSATAQDEAKIASTEPKATDIAAVQPNSDTDPAQETIDAETSNVPAGQPKSATAQDEAKIASTEPKATNVAAGQPNSDTAPAPETPDAEAPNVPARQRNSATAPAPEKPLHAALELIKYLITVVQADAER